jgi:putative methionine-R-sulfoxide reductase with GAF domain
MKETTMKLMKQYNELVTRYKKAEKYFADVDVNTDDKIEQADNIKALINKMDITSKQIELTGYYMKEHEYLNGFLEVADESTSQETG